jgi:WD40 repeat protein
VSIADWIATAPTLTPANADEMEEIDAFLGHESWIFEVEFSPDGDLLVSSGVDGTVRL